MTDNLKKAKRTLDEGSHTLVLCSDTQTYTDTARGVAPLLSFVDNGKSLRGFCAADKVVGAGAAYLYVLLGAEEVYANVISQRAKEILDSAAIPLFYGEIVDHIVNRQKNGPCPIEAAVSGAADEHDALVLIKTKLKELSKQK